jgi:tetratricopeptide (TPR) repeat protein
MSFAQNLTGNLLEILTKAALAVLTAVMLVMLVQHELAARNSATVLDSREQELLKIQQRMELDSKIFHEIAVFFEQRQYRQAMDKLKEVRATHPDSSTALLWQARLEYEEGMIAESLASYRKTVDSEPGFIDRKSPLFVGQSIKQKVEESQEKLQREMQLKPNDLSVKKALDDLLYLKRRLAGGCE